MKLEFIAIFMTKVESPRSPLSFFSREKGGHHIISRSSGTRTVHEMKEAFNPAQRDRKGKSGMRAFEIDPERGKDERLTILWIPGEEVDSLTISSTKEPIDRVVRQNGVWTIGFARRNGEDLRTTQYDATDGSLLLQDPPPEEDGTIPVPASLNPQELSLLADTFMLLGFPKKVESLGREVAEKQFSLRQPDQLFTDRVFDLAAFHVARFPLVQAHQPLQFEL